MRRAPATQKKKKKKTLGNQVLRLAAFYNNNNRGKNNSSSAPGSTSQEARAKHSELSGTDSGGLPVEPDKCGGRQVSVLGRKGATWRAEAGPIAEQVQPVPQGPRAGGLLGSAQQRERGTRHAVGVVLTHRVLEVEVLSVSGHRHARQEGQDVIVGLQDRRVRVAAPGPARERGPGPGSVLCLPPKGLRTQRGVWFLALPRPGRFPNPRSRHVSSCFPSTQSIHARGGSRPRAGRKHFIQDAARLQRGLVSCRGGG